MNQNLLSDSGFNIGDKLKFQNSTASDTYTDFGSLLSNILPNIYIALGLILFVLIVAGGFMVIASAGNPDKQKQGSEIITGALIGALVVFASYWIIQIIQIVTGVPILNSTL